MKHCFVCFHAFSIDYLFIRIIHKCEGRALLHKIPVQLSHLFYFANLKPVFAFPGFPIVLLILSVGQLKNRIQLPWGIVALLVNRVVRIIWVNMLPWGYEWIHNGAIKSGTRGTQHFEEKKSLFIHDFSICIPWDPFWQINTVHRGDATRKKSIAKITNAKKITQYLTRLYPHVRYPYWYLHRRSKVSVQNSQAGQHGESKHNFKLVYIHQLGDYASLLGVLLLNRF